MPRTFLTDDMGSRLAPLLPPERGGIATKIHLISDAHGNPLDFLTTPGQAHESKSAQVAIACIVLWLRL
jgi:hypothetical protein